MRSGSYKDMKNTEQEKDFDADAFIETIRNEAQQEAELAVWRARPKKSKSQDTTHRREDAEQSELFE